MSADRNQTSAERNTQADDRFDDLLQASLLDDDVDHDAADDLDSEEAISLSAEDKADLLLMREALGNYKAESLRFAAGQSAALPVPRVSRAAALWDGTPRWAVAITAIAIATCSTLFVSHRASEPAPAALAAAPTTQTLQADNNLLLSVDQALNTSVAPTEAELGLTSVPVRATQHHRSTN